MKDYWNRLFSLAFKSLEFSYSMILKFIVARQRVLVTVSLENLYPSIKNLGIADLTLTT